MRKNRSLRTESSNETNVDERTRVSLFFTLFFRHLLRRFNVLNYRFSTLEFEIHMYRGRDPLEPYFNYVLWLEKHSRDDITAILEDVLVKFKEIPAYQQDPRLVHILVEYVSFK